MVYNLTGFLDVRIFPLFLVMTSLKRHFLSHGFQICIFCGGYQSAKNFNAVDCLGQVLQRITKKHNNDVIMTSFNTFGI